MSEQAKEFESTSELVSTSSRSQSSTGPHGPEPQTSSTAHNIKRNNHSHQSLSSATSNNTELIPASFSSATSARHGDDYEMLEDHDDVSPFYETAHRYQEDYAPLKKASSTLRHVTRVSKRAALASKKVIWDSNDNAIDAAQSAVDQWEDVYNALRGLMVASMQSAKGVYGAAKIGANSLEHGILLPVRDWILLPAFGGVEWAAVKTVGFLQSDQAALVAKQILQLAKQVPGIGPTVLVPSMVLSVQMLQTSWEIAKYPIPSRHQVRASVDFVLTGTKWAISTTVREVLLYMKRADAIITRTLSHTQWKVLGSGPYATLDKLNKQEVIDHLCERYFSLTGSVARYELAAHIRAHNLPLYLDLVLTGLLRKRGGELTKDDEWLSSRPSYRKNSKVPFLLPNYDSESDDSADNPEEHLTEKESSLWFRLPYINGKRPGRDTPWVRYSGEDRVKLEKRYLEVYKEGKCNTETKPINASSTAKNPQTPLDNDAMKGTGLQWPSTSEDKSTKDCEETANDCANPLDVSSKYPTIAQWYVPDVNSDVMVDQKRYSVSIFYCCPKCRRKHDPRALQSEVHPPMTPPKYGDLCQECKESQAKVTNHWMASSILSPPPLSMTMRPNLHRFHGPGDEVRRGVWFLDTRRHGLQPYGEEAQAVLEDAYLFLQWRNQVLKEGVAESERKRPKHEPIIENTCRDDGNDAVSDNKSKDLDDDPLGENALLTVQVESPDGGEQQLVQFSSLTSATAIRQGLGGAITLFKRRVYRGADLSIHKLPETVLGVTPEDLFSGSIDLKSQSISDPHHIEEPDEISLTGSDIDLDSEGEDCQDVAEGDSWSVLPPPSKEESLAVPSCQFDEKDRFLTRSDDDAVDDKSDDIDHLVLVVHGIGEMLQSAVPLFGLSIPNLSSIVDCCGFLRKNHSEVQNARFSQMYPTAESTATASTGRVEYLPVEWHEAFSIVSQRMSPTRTTSETPELAGEQPLVRVSSRSSQVMMQDISLRTIPQMRSFANDTLMDVLYFMSDEHHDIIIDIVTKEMNVVVQKFRALTGFDGRVSIIGHSLGSIITWDILEHQAPPATMNVSYAEHDTGSTPCNKPYWERSSSSSSEDNLRLPGSESPYADAVGIYRSVETQAVSTFKYPKLSFDVDNAFMLGSPIPVFLMVRNQRKPLSADFSLNGCHRVFNIFHPYDPVAYRIEPLIDPRNADFEPKIMTHWNGGFRVQYQTKRMWRKLVQTTMKTQQRLIQSLEAAFAGMGLLDSAGEGFEEDNESQPNSNMADDERSTGHIVNTGALNQGRRIDYMLQEKEIEAANEYVAAFAAHSGYWIEKDLSLFVARQIYLSRLAHEQALHLDNFIPHEDMS